MKAKTAIVIGFLVVSGLLVTPTYALAQNVSVDNSVTIDTLRAQLISILMEQVRMLQEQIDELKNDKETPAVEPTEDTDEDEAPVDETPVPPAPVSNPAHSQA